MRPEESYFFLGAAFLRLGAAFLRLGAAFLAGLRFATFLAGLRLGAAFLAVRFFAGIGFTSFFVKIFTLFDMTMAHTKWLFPTSIVGHPQMNCGA